MPSEYLKIFESGRNQIKYDREVIGVSSLLIKISRGER